MNIFHDIPLNLYSIIFPVNMNLWMDVDCLMVFHAFQFPRGGAAVTFSLGFYVREKNERLHGS